MTGIPVPTIRKTLSGETANPSYEVVSKLMAAMGGIMDEPKKTENELEKTKREESDDMQIVFEQIKSLYDARISDLWNMINKISAEKRTLFFTMIGTITVMVVFIVYLFIDGMHGNWGFFQY